MFLMFFVPCLSDLAVFCYLHNKTLSNKCPKGFVLKCFCIKEARK